MYKNKHKYRFKIKNLVLLLILFAFFFSFSNAKAEITNIGDTEDFEYTGNVQTFTAPFDGSYKLRVWGAQGGSVHGYDGGYGGYAEGNVHLHTGDTIYIYVGGQGVGATSVGQDLAGGYNGGGSVTGNSSINHINASGGGATHIAFVSGLLNTLESQKDKILIVAGGGGGARWQENYTEYSNGARQSYGGHGGGNTGSHVTQYGTYSWRETINGVGTQTSGYQFGQGENITGNSAGGGGFYGGKSYDLSGAGGSGYIGNSKLKNKLMFMYSESPSEFINNDENTKTLSGIISFSTAEDRTAKKGNGYAKVTYAGSNDATLSFLSVTNYELDKNFSSKKHEYSLPIFEESLETIEINAVANDINATISGNGIINVPYGKTSHEIIVTAQDGTIDIYRINLNREVTPKDKYTYNYTGDVQTFIVPVTGKYKLETWGAQGGSVDGTYSGGYGAYSTGEIKLKQNDIVYIYVGGEGQSTTDGYNEDVAGGYNGGGAANVSSTSCSSATQYKSSGGGATHMATTSGLLNTLSSNRDKILIVSSGGGGGYYIQDDNCYNEHAYTNGGSGAGYKSKVETLDSIDYTDTYTCYPSTQTSAGYCTYNGETKGAAAFGTGGSYMMGGGSGYYGGASGSSKKSQGGVSYIGNTKLTNKYMTCYSCEISNDEATKTYSNVCHNSKPTEDCAKSGNGYAKITLLGIESDDATLKSLSVTGQELKQAFKSERLEYDLLLDEDVTNVEINAEANNENATLTYNTNIELTTNPQLEQIIVTAQDGTINVYSINIKRVKKSYLKKWIDTKFYLIADNQSDSITTLRKATTAEYNAAKDSFSDLNTISLANSPYPAYAWKDNDSILFYSEADIVYLNPDSIQYFSTFTNATSIDLSFFDTSKVTKMTFMFKDLSKLTSIDVSNFDTSKVTSMNGMFSGLSSITSLDVSNFDTSNVTHMNGTFANLKSLNDLDLSNFDTSNVTDMGSMFQNTVVPDGIDLSSFDTSNVKNMNNMFYNTKTPKLDLKHFDVSKVNDFGSIFTLTDVDEIDISGWVFNVSSLSSIFYNSKVTKLILDDIDTSSLTTMRSMFSGLLKLKEVDLSSLDTENVTDMSYMFYASDSIETLDLSSFDTRKVTTMENMFTTNNSETALRSINLSSFKVYNVTNMYGMFEDAKHLESIDLSSFDVSSVTTMERMFSNCNSLKTVDLSNFNSPQLTNISGMFSSNNNLERIYANESFSTENVVYSNVFTDCGKLVGGMGTMYSYNNRKSTYARVDDPENGRPGYFTYKEFKPTIYYPDDTFEEVTFNSLFTFPENWPKENENVSTVTFKYQNGEEDYISNVTKSFNLYRWKINDSTYSPSSDKNIIADTYLEPIYNETIEGAEFPEEPTSEHATFLGWYTEPVGGIKKTSYGREEDITLYAHWNNEDMTISFEENGGEEINDITIPYNSELGDLPTTTKSGYVLEGWYSNEELTNKVSSKTKVKDNMTLYAKWGDETFPIVFEDDEETFDGTNYLNTHIKLYNEENILKDYEIGFTIENIDVLEQYATFVQDKYELESIGYPGLIVRINVRQGELKTNIGHKRNETDAANYYFENFPSFRKVKIVRKDNVVYYSFNDGDLELLHDINGFDNFFETETTFGAALDENNNPFRYLKGTLSNMYIRLGEMQDDHTVTYPDGTIEVYPHNTVIDLGINETSEADEEGATVTFKYNNGEEDTTSKVTIKHPANGFKIGDVHYDDESTLLVDSDKVIEYDYGDKNVSAEFPADPEKEHYNFTGWYNEDTKYTEYTGDSDITLNAEYEKKTINITLPDSTIVTIDEGESYELPENTVEKIDDNIAAITFKYHDDETEDLVKYVKKSYTPNGWIVDDEHYDDNESITPAHDITLIPDYIETIIPAEFPNDPELQYNIFNGWFNQEEGGNKYTEYAEEHDITLHAQWTEETVHVTLPDEEFDIPKGIEVPVPLNYIDKPAEIISTVHLHYNNNDDDDDMFVNKVYDPNGWEIDGEHYDAGDTYVFDHDVELIPIYTERIEGVTLPTDVEKEHYEFSSWHLDENLDDEPITTYNGEEDIDVYAKWIGEEVTIEVYTDSDTPEILVMHYGDTYTFDDLEDSYLVELGDVVFDFNDGVTPNNVQSQTMTITNPMWFSYNPSTYEEDAHNPGDQITVTSDLEIYIDGDYTSSEIIIPDNPTKEHYVFNGWYDEWNNELNPDNIFAPVTYTAKWRGEDITVHTPDGDITVEYGKEYDIPDNDHPKENTDEATVTFDPHNGEEVTIGVVQKQYAQIGWLVNGVHYDANSKVTYYEESTLEPEYDYVVIPVTFPSNPTKFRSDFVGWFTEENSGEEIDSYDKLEDTVIHAHWTKHIPDITTPEGIDHPDENDQYQFPVNNYSKDSENIGTVTFVLNNGESNIVRDIIKNYTPNGWTLNNEHYDSESITTILDDCEIIPDYTSEITPIVFPSNPVKQNYTFVGWYTASHGGDKITEYNGEESITIYARYKETDPTAEEYILPSDQPDKPIETLATVTFKYHNGDPDTYGYVQKKYLINGWLVDGVYHHNGDVILKTDSTVIEPNYNEIIIGADYPENPEKENSKFTGWYTEETGGEKVFVYRELQDITLHAQYTDNYTMLKPGPDLSIVLKYSFLPATEERYQTALEKGVSFTNLAMDGMEPVYYWCDSSEQLDNSYFYYSNADVIFMNPDSSYLFSGRRYNLYNVDMSNLNSIYVTNLSYFTYSSGQYYRTFNISNLDTSNVTTMNYAFYFGNNKHITTLDLSSFNTHKVVDFSDFIHGEGITSLNISNLDTRSATDMSRMFNHLAITTLDLSSFDTSNVEDFGSMFAYDKKIVSMDLSNFDTRNATYIGGMFMYCDSLENINVSGFDTSNVENMQQMFYRMKNIEEIDISSFTTKENVYIRDMFSNSPKLKTIYVSDKWNPDNVYSPDTVFFESTNIVGQKGTTYSYARSGKQYARIDNAPDDPGLLTNKYPNTYIITLPDNTTEKIKDGEEYTIPSNTYTKADDTLYTVTFDPQNGEEVITSSTVKKYNPDGFKINDTVYASGDTIRVYSDITLVPNYIEIIEPASFPEEPTKTGFDFLGWYTEETDGEKVDSLDNIDSDTTLYAHYENSLPTDMSFDSDDVTILVGETHQIEVTFDPDGSHDVLTYTGFDNEKIDVTDGIITGLEVGTTTITIGTENTDIEKTINVTVIGDKITSQVLNVLDKTDDRIVIGEEPLTNVNDFLDKLDNPKEYLVVYDKDDNLIDPDDYDDTTVGTGLKVKLVINNIEHDEVIVIIRGDINGNGVVDVTDEAIMTDHILGAELIEDYRIYAADLKEDEIVDVSDDAKITDYILGAIDSLNE